MVGFRGTSEINFLSSLPSPPKKKTCGWWSFGYSWKIVCFLPFGPPSQKRLNGVRVCVCVFKGKPRKTGFPSPPPR